jgi:hypothetical protein
MKPPAFRQIPHSYNTRAMRLQRRTATPDPQPYTLTRNAGSEPP